MNNKRKRDDPRLLGVLGGMGPAATIDFMDKIVRVTKAKKDQEQIPAIIYNNTLIPDRNEAYLSGGPSPASELVRSAQILENAGCDLIAIPCNTAHIWYDEIDKNTSVEILNVPQIVSKKLLGCTKVGIICTTPVRQSGLYEKKLAHKGISILNTKDQEKVMEAIYKVKAGELEEAGFLFMEQINYLKENGVDRIIAGCSEVPVALKGENFFGTIVDPMEYLAEECARLFHKL